MKNLVYVVFNFVHNLVLNVKRKLYPNLQEVIADILFEDLDVSLCEKDITYIYNKIVKVFCRKYKVKAPRLMFKQIDLNDIFMGLFECEPYTISINVKSLILNNQNRKDGFTAVNLLVFVLLHELRHCWQYKYHKEDTMYFSSKENNWLYNEFYLNTSIELDANRFAESAGIKDDEEIFNKLPISLYENFSKAVGLKAKTEASRKIEASVAALKRKNLE